MSAEIPEPTPQEFVESLLAVNRLLGNKAALPDLDREAIVHTALHLITFPWWLWKTEKWVKWRNSNLDNRNDSHRSGDLAHLILFAFSYWIEIRHAAVGFSPEAFDLDTSAQKMYMLFSLIGKALKGQSAPVPLGLNHFAIERGLVEMQHLYEEQLRKFALSWREGNPPESATIDISIPMVSYFATFQSLALLDRKK